MIALLVLLFASQAAAGSPPSCESNVHGRVSSRRPPDSLPYIGPHRRYPRHWFALGYGGNGMTFGFDANAIAALAMTVRSLAAAAEVWCVFDDTASGAAIENACELREQLVADPPLAW